MGKRKKSSRKPQGPKKRDPLSTTFQCLFCNHENSVTVKIDRKANVGDLMCKVCGQHFQTGVNYLSAAVDVYSDWVDACDAVAKQAADSMGNSAVNSNREIDHASRMQTHQQDEDEFEDDGFIERDDLDAEAEYAGD